MITSWSKEKRKILARNILFLSNAYENETGCWIWDGSADVYGRGKTAINNKLTTAPRAAWIRFVGPIPASLHVLHKCDVPACINPEHLFLGTHLENVQDMIEKGRKYYRQPTMATCHPDKPQAGKGLCQRCWRRQYYLANNY